MRRIIHFSRYRYIMIVLSLACITTGIAGYFINGGFNLGIDFKGGVTEQLQIKPGAASAPIRKVREALAALQRFDLQVVGNPARQEYILKVMAVDEKPDFQNRTEAQILKLLGDAFGAENIVIESSDFVGPRYSRELASETFTLTFVALALILVYTAFRFKIISALAAVLCLIHDSFFMLGVIALFRLEVSTNTIAAILTIIGYSLNDTIVIYDRIRENQGLMREADLETIIDTSNTQTLSRSLLTTGTTLIAVAALYILGTGAIKEFSLNLLVGLVVGSYSSIFIASPLVLDWSRAVERRRKRRELEKFGRADERQPRAAESSQADERFEPTPETREEIPAGEGESPQPASLPSGIKPDITFTRIQPVRGKRKKRRH